MKLTIWKTTYRLLTEQKHLFQSYLSEQFAKHVRFTIPHSITILTINLIYLTLVYSNF